MAEPVCLYKGKKMRCPLFPPTLKLLHLVEFTERLFFRNGASAAVALLEGALLRRVTLGEVRRCFDIIVIQLVN